MLALLTVVVLAITLAWLVRTEQGSRWLLQQGLGISPVSIEANGITGTLAEGLGVQSLTIALPLAEIRIAEIVVSWRPSSLLTGMVDIERARIAELSVDILESDSSDDASRDPEKEPGDDASGNELFWLAIPLDIYIESGQLDKLRIDAVEFDKLNVTGSIGHGRLEIETVEAITAGIKLQASGELSGPEPGRLNAAASWEMADENLGGSGSFNGNIEKLAFRQVINVPETINFNGSIHDLFRAPSLEAVAEWQSVRLPGETILYSNDGHVTVNSDFRTARLDGNSVILLEGWPQANLKLQALADLQAVTIDSYAIDGLDGHITGSGRIDYGEGVHGQLAMNAGQIDTGLINSDLPGRLGFEASLQIESAKEFMIDIAAAQATIVDRNFTGRGSLHWRDAKLAAIDAGINAGSNRLTADIKLDKRLAGLIDASAPELAMLWPDLEGALDATITLGGSLEQPQARVTARATSVSFGPQSIDRLVMTGELQSDNRITGSLAAAGLVSDQQQIGNLDYTLNGTLAEHESALNLAGGVVDVKLRASGGWDGKFYTQQFEYGEVRPEGFEVWKLEQNPQLSLSVDSGHVSAHCWKQQDASICIDASNWDENKFQSTAAIKDFALASLQPLLSEGYSIDGTVNADLKFMRDKAGLQAGLHWRQSRTVVTYSDNIDTLQTTFEKVELDLGSDNAETNLDANLSGEQGLNMTVTARISGPLDAESPLEAEAKGRLPSIGLLRPLLQRVFNPGKLQGELKIDLNAGGTLGDPLFTGGAYLVDGTLGLLGAGVTFTDINIAAQSKGSDKLLVTGEFRSGEGSGEILGEVRAVEDTDLAADIRIQGQNLAMVRFPDLSVNTSPDLKLHIGEGIFDISGSIVIPYATAQIRDLPKNAIPKSSDVIVHTPERAEDEQKGTIVTGDVEVILGDDVHFSGFGLSSRLDGGLRLTQKRYGQLRSDGTVRVRDGYLTGYGKELRVDRGELTFTGPLDDPLINIQVSRESSYEGRLYTIGLRLTGTAQNVKTEPFSRPTMSERDVLSFLLLDRPAGSDSDASGAALALGLQQLLPDQSGRFGLDEVSFETNDANEAAMVAGKRINEKLYVRYVFGSLGAPGSFRIRYRLGRGFSLEASTGSKQSMDLIYMLER